MESGLRGGGYLLPRADGDLRHGRLRDRDAGALPRLVALGEHVHRRPGGGRVQRADRPCLPAFERCLRGPADTCHLTDHVPADHHRHRLLLQTGRDLPQLHRRYAGLGAFWRFRLPGAAALRVHGVRRLFPVADGLGCGPGLFDFRHTQPARARLPGTARQPGVRNGAGHQSPQVPAPGLRRLRLLHRSGPERSLPATSGSWAPTRSTSRCCCSCSP